MNDETMTRDERIAAAEARQDELHETGGSTAERMDRLSALRDRILNGDTTE